MEIEQKEVIRRLKILSSTQSLSNACLKVIFEAAIRRRIPIGKNLWTLGDQADFFAILLKGAIEIVLIRENGKETCVGLFGPGNTIGISAFLKRSQYPATARAISKDTEVLKVHLRSAVTDKSHKIYEEVGSWLRDQLMSHEDILREKIDLLSIGRAEIRIFELLRQLSVRFGVRMGPHEIEIPLKISKTQLARLAEIRVETMIRKLNSWQKLGIIGFHDRGIHIPDIEKLEYGAKQR